MCFKFMNGSKTTKFLREHEVCLLKRRFRVGLGVLEQRACQSLKGSGSREVKLPGTRSSGDEWFAPLTVTEHRMLLTRDLKQLASGKGLHRRACNQTPDGGSQEDHFLVLPPCFRRESWAFPLLSGKAQILFPQEERAGGWATK